MKRPGVLIFMPSYGDGGVERMMVNLANGLVEAGAAASIAAKRWDGPYLGRLSAEVQRVALPAVKDRALVQPLLDFLRAERPDAVLSAKERDDRIALAVKSRFGEGAPRFYPRIGTSLGSREQSRSFLWLKGWLKRRALRRLYAHADGLIANSEGVARELAVYADLPLERIHIVPNPAATPDIQTLARAPLDHPWFVPGAPPTILGIGRLCRAKDFSTLIRAFALLRERRSCRLMILGEGGQRPALEDLAVKLGVEADLALPGFVANPFAYLARAALFALSSQREGCPNVLIEALAVGVPAVACDCPSGPREILAEGLHGRLVPPGDAEALAQAMAQTLDDPSAPERLRQAVSRYTPENSARAYLRAFGLRDA
jgi:glycosyltransferase involved in cell wall biosynthesis